MKYELVPFHTVAEFIAKNAKRHVDELKEDIVQSMPQIDWEYYLSLSEAGECMASIMSLDGEIKGYLVFIIMDNPMFKNRKEANSQWVYIFPEHRNCALNFIKKTNEYLKKLGVDDITYIIGNERIGKLLKLAGMKDTHKLWSI